MYVFGFMEETTLPAHAPQGKKQASSTQKGPSTNCYATHVTNDAGKDLKYTDPIM